MRMLDIDIVFNLPSHLIALGLNAVASQAL